MRERKYEIKMDLYKLYEVNKDVRKNGKHLMEQVCGSKHLYKEWGKHGMF